MQASILVRPSFNWMKVGWPPGPTARKREKSREPIQVRLEIQRVALRVFC